MLQLTTKYYKAFDKDFKCRGTQFKVDDTFTLPNPPVICEYGFHFCKYPCFIKNYYYWINDLSIRFAEVEPIGIIVDDSVNKYVTDRIKIIREIHREEFITLCTGQFFDIEGNKYKFKNGELHCEDGPAVIHTDGRKEYYQNDKFHRLDGPATVDENGIERWYKNGLLHRLDSPAVKYPDCREEWYKDGKHHRIGGPAVKYLDGSEEYYEDGLFHRIDGPARKCADGSEEWYLNGNRYPMDVLF
jgi:hypothetical protein